MTTLDIGGNQIQVDDSFLKLSPDDQNSTVQQIAQSLGVKSAPEESLAGSTKSVAAGLVESIPQLLGAPADIAGLLGVKGTEPYGGAALTKKMEEKVTGPLYKSQTAFENVLRTIGNFGAGALFPGGIATRAANVVVPALATEAAGALTNDNPIAKTLAAVGGAAGVSKIGRIGELAAAKAKLPPTPTSVEEVRAALPDMYNTPAIQTTEIAPHFAEGVVNQFNNASKATQRYTIKDPGVQKVYNIMEDLKTPEFGANHTMRDFENTRQLLADQVLTDMNASKISKDLAKKAQQSIEQSLLSVKNIPIVAGDANQAALDLARARAQAFTGFKLEKVDNYLANAGIDAAKQHSGMNLENIIYQKIAPDLKNNAAKLRLAGWNDMEIGALQAVLPGRFASTTRKVANFLGGGGGIGGIGSSYALGHLLGPLAGAAPFTVGPFLKHLGGGIAQGKLDRVKQVIGAGAPAYAPYREQFMALRNAPRGSLPPAYQQAILGLLAEKPKQQ